MAVSNAQRERESSKCGGGEKENGEHEEMQKLEIVGSKLRELAPSEEVRKRGMVSVRRCRS